MSSKFPNDTDSASSQTVRRYKVIEDPPHIPPYPLSSLGLTLLTRKVR